MERHNFPYEAIHLDGKGGSLNASHETTEYEKPSGAALTWLHLDYSRSDSASWLQNLSSLDPVITANLLDDDTRPRAFLFQNGIFLSLRGVNLNPGADPEDMIAVRIWITPEYVITSTRRQLLSLQDIRIALEQQRGPISAPTFLAFLIERLAIRAEGILDKLEDNIWKIEEPIEKLSYGEQRNRLSDIRRQAIRMRRYLAPQKEALHTLLSESPEWLNKSQKIPIRESLNKFNRFLEELDQIRDRAIVAQEELLSQLSELLNQRMYTLSLVATFFLPLGFLTGLFGINVGGIPLSENRLGFLTVCFGLLMLVTVMVLLMKRKKWF